MINQNFIYIGTLLNLIGCGLYIRETLRGKTSPNRVTWFVLSIAPMVAFASMMSQGVGFRQSLMTFIVGFSPFLIFISSFLTKHASWKINRFDIICGALALLGLVLWILTDEANIAILLAVAADFLAFLPTLVKSFAHPDSESWELFGLGVINGAIALLIITKWDFAHAAFPLYLFAADFLAVLFIRFKAGLLITKLVKAENR